MNDEPDTSKPQSELDGLEQELLDLRADAIGVARRAERVLETLGRPVRSSVITRREQRESRRKR